MPILTETRNPITACYVPRFQAFITVKGHNICIFPRFINCSKCEIMELIFTFGRLTFGHLAVGSSWLSVGSEKGNLYFVNVRQFTTSGYVINWNKAIDL